MIVRRFWIDGDGWPHTEEATLVSVGDGPGVNPPGGQIELDGPPLSGPARVVAVADPACGVGALGEGLAELWEAPLLEGARIVGRPDWEAAVSEIAADRAAQLAELQAGV